MILLFFIGLFSSVFTGELNYAPKIEHPKTQKPLVLIVCSYNNQEYYKGNLDSIFCQNYQNYRVIYINDASTDNTGELVQEYFREKRLEHKVTYIENPVNQKAMHNIYRAVHSCKNEEIILLIDGDDRLYANNALKRVNQAYCDDDVWVTYGQSKKGFGPLKKDQKCASKPCEKKTLKEAKHRQLAYCWSHLRTFYAGLFKKIPVHKFMYRGKFMDSGWDIPIIINLIDLARDHTYFIPDVIYQYNMQNPISDSKVRWRFQKFYANVARNRPKMPFYFKSREGFLKY